MLIYEESFARVTQVRLVKIEEMLDKKDFFANLSPLLCTPGAQKFNTLSRFWIPRLASLPAVAVGITNITSKNYIMQQSLFIGYYFFTEEIGSEMEVMSQISIKMIWKKIFLTWKGKPGSIRDYTVSFWYNI